MKALHVASNRAETGQRTAERLAAGNGSDFLRTVGLFFALVAVLVLLPVHAIDGGAAASGSVTVTDLAGRTLDVPLAPDRIICLAPGTLRLVCYLGGADRVVGIEEMEKRRPKGRPYWLANPDLHGLPVIGPGGPKSINQEPDLEAVLKVRPQVVFASYMSAGRADALQRKIGIPVVVVSYGRVGSFDKEVYVSLRLVASILKKDKRAEEIVSFVEQARRDLLARTEGLDDAAKPTAYVGAVGYKGFQGVESTDAGYVPFEWVRAKNVAKGAAKDEHLFIEKEQLLVWNPDVIFIDGGGLSLVKQDFERKTEFYAGLKAFKEKRVYLLWPFNMYATNIATAMADAYAIGKILTPERFRDIDPKMKADQVYSFLVGKPLYNQMEKDFGQLGRALLFPR